MDPTPDNIAYLYDGSVEGLFTAVFLTYANKEHPLDICPANTISRASGKPHARSKPISHLPFAFKKA